MPSKKKCKKKKPGEGIAQKLEAQAIGGLVRRAKVGDTLSRSEVLRLARYEREQRETRFRETAARLPQKVVVDLLATSRKVLLEWEAAGMPRNSDRSYDLFAVLIWLKRRWLRGEEEDNGVGASSEQLERLRRIRADMAQIELDARRGEIVERAEVEAQWSRLFAALKQRLLSLGSSLGPRLEGQHARDIARELNDEMRCRLNDLAKQCREWWGE